MTHVIPALHNNYVTAVLLVAWEGEGGGASGYVALKRSWEEMREGGRKEGKKSFYSLA